MLDYDQLANEYALHRQVHPEVIKNLLTVSALDRRAKVLEVGCGTGNYIVALQSVLDCHCWGTDPSEQMLAQARTRSSPVQFQPGRAERIDFPTGFFDLVFSVDVIHHVEHRFQFFQEAFRVLKAQGSVCTVTDSADIIRRRQPLAVYFPETIEVELKRYPGMDTLREFMGRAGFEQIGEFTVEFTSALSDIQMYRDKAFSSLHLIPEEAFRRGIERLERDLQQGPIRYVPRYLLLWGKKPARGEEEQG